MGGQGGESGYRAANARKNGCTAAATTKVRALSKICEGESRIWVLLSSVSSERKTSQVKVTSTTKATSGGDCPN